MRRPIDRRGHTRRAIDLWLAATAAMATGAMATGAMATRAMADPPATSAADTAPTTTPAAATAPFAPGDHLLGDPFGRRSALAAAGLTVDPSLAVDDSKVLRGGLNTRDDAPRGLFALAVTADAGKLLGLTGGTAYAQLNDRFGARASATQVGDVQNFVLDTDQGGAVQLSQLYYRQALLPGDALVVKAGKVDANADFDVLENAQEFLNSSWGGNPTIGLFPTYPNTATGVDVFALPGQSFYGGGGLFDGSLARGIRTGAYGPAKFLGRGDNLFLMAEVGSRFNLPLGRVIPALADAKLAGHVGVGGWYSTDRFTPFGGRPTSGTGGTYAVLDQVVWRPSRGPAEAAGVPGQYPTGAPPAEEDPRSVAVDVSYARAESDVNLIDDSVIGGLTWVGPVPGRGQDVAGVGVLVAGFGPAVDRRAQAETSVEAFYRLRLAPAVSVKPDVQYIFHPNGNGPTTGRLVKDALVVDIRAEVAF